MGDPGAYDTFWITNPTRCRIYSMRHKISGDESYKVLFEDGMFYNLPTLQEIRDRLASY